MVSPQEGLKLSLGVGGRKVLDFGRIWLHALGSDNCAIEGNLRLPDVALCAVEDNAMFFGCLHQLQEVSVMLLRGMTIDTYIIMNVDYAG